MDKKTVNIIKLCSVLLAAVIALIAVAPIELAGSDEGRKWMSLVDDATPINELSIPGTHDSGAVHSIADLSGRCQTLGIGSQLNIGVRFFDIRLGQVGEDELRVVHSFVDQATDFDDTLDIMASFIRENPKEFLILSIKEDTDAVGAGLPFGEAVYKALAAHKDVVDLSSELPETLGEARGKIYILSRFDQDFGIPAHMGWRDSTSFELGEYFIQDNYCIGSVEEKKADILAAIEVAKAGSYRLTINFASCYIDGVLFPPTYAGTPAVEINAWLRGELDKGDGCVGVILCDFIESRLAAAIYRRNLG